MLITIIALVFLAPPGIALAWYYRFWSERVRIIVSAVFAVFFLIVLGQ